MPSIDMFSLICGKWGGEEEKKRKVKQGKW
jgi:hypothetical protein